MNSCFSKIVIIPERYEEDKVDKLIQEIFEDYLKGIKFTIIVFSKVVLNKIVFEVNNLLSKERLYFENGQLYINFTNKIRRT